MSEPQPIMLQHDYEAFGLHWRLGEPFKYRLWLALRLIEPNAAKTYFRTTS